MKEDFDHLHQSGRETAINNKGFWKEWNGGGPVFCVTWRFSSGIKHSHRRQNTLYVRCLATAFTPPCAITPANKMHKSWRACVVSRSRWAPLLHYGEVVLFFLVDSVFWCCGIMGFRDQRDNLCMNICSLSLCVCSGKRDRHSRFGWVRQIHSAHPSFGTVKARGADSARELEDRKKMLGKTLVNDNCCCMGLALRTCR